MTITYTSQLQHFGIERILIADDTFKNRIAAACYFSALPVEVDIVASARLAQEKIREGYDVGKPYQLVLSDMQMEEEKSGMAVAREAFKHFAFGYIVTAGKDHRHGTYEEIETTILLPILPLGGNETVQESKQKAGTWGILLGRVLDDLAGENGRLYAALRRQYQSGMEPSERTAEIAMRLYDLRLYNLFD